MKHIKPVAALHGGPQYTIGLARPRDLTHIPEIELAGDVPVGFAHVEPLDAGTVHLEEIDVLPDHGRPTSLRPCAQSSRARHAAASIQTAASS